MTAPGDLDALGRMLDTYKAAMHPAAEIAARAAVVAAFRAIREERDEAEAQCADAERFANAESNRALAAERAADELRGALIKLEWSFRQTALRNGGTIYTATLCPACMGEKDPPDDKGARRRRGDPLPAAGHKPDCWLARALAASSPTKKEGAGSSGAAATKEEA